MATQIAIKMHTPRGLSKAKLASKNGLSKSTQQTRMLFTSQGFIAMELLCLIDLMLNSSEHIAKTLRCSSEYQEATR